MVQKRLVSNESLSKDEWKDPDVIGKFFFECIENIEGMGAYSTVDGGDALTCMDYILSHMSVQGAKERIKSPVYVRTNPDSYNGSNPRLRELLSAPSRGWIPGELVEISEAIDEFYLKNPLANPDHPHCSIIMDNPDTGWESTTVNCLTKILDMHRNNVKVVSGYDSLKYFKQKHETNSVSYKIAKIANSGARCGLYHSTTYNGIDVHRKTSCMESLMEAGIFYTRSVSASNTFGYNINDYDLSLDCLSDLPELSKTVPCIQKLIQSNPEHAYTQFLMRYSDSSDVYEAAANNMYETLTRKYKFVKTSEYDAEESSALDYAINSRTNVGLLMKAVMRSPNGVLSFPRDTLCFTDDKRTPVSCFSKLLVQIRDNKYENEKSVSRDALYDALDTRSLSRAAIEEGCYDNNSDPIPCVSIIIDILQKRHARLSRLFDGIIDRAPLSDFMCSESSNGVPRIINCLDKIVGSSTVSSMDIIRNNDVILDRMECTDWNGSPITCIDKLFQRHEMWVHNHFRAGELRRLDIYFKGGAGKEKVTKDIAELRVLSEEYNIDEDPGYLNVSREYDSGALKVHSPSKTFERFKGIIESQLQDYKIEFPGDNSPLYHSEEQVRYAQELLRSVTSEKSSKEVQIVPRIYKMADVYNPTTDKEMETVGIASLIGYIKSNPTTLNMFECRDTDTGTTISCIQKQIDTVKKAIYSSRGHSTVGSVDNVMAYKDLFKPGMCVQPKTGEKMTCMEYAYKQLHSHFTDRSYITLISRKDFNKIAGIEIDTPNGKSTVLEAVCKRSSIRKIANYLYDTKTLDTVTNGNPTFNGAALSTFGQKCACINKPTPLDRRICLDTACFNAYVPLSTTRENDDGDDEDVPHWAPGFIGRYPYTEHGVRDAMYPYIYHDSQDYFGIGGVYDLTYKPSEYRITNTERFNYDEAVHTLFDAIKRVEGTKLSRLGDKKNIKIEEITLFPPGDGREDYDIQVVFTELGTGEPGEEKGWVEHYSAASIFLRGGLLNRDDIRMKAIRYKNENDIVEKILTRGSGKSDSTSSIKLIISNRPADYMRASTCQDWSSCMNLEDGAYNFALPFFMGTGGYVAYLASDEFAPNWYSRSIMMPVMRYKRGDKRDGDHDNEDPNNTFRVNGVYGLSMYKPLLNDAIQVVLRDHGYNAPGSYITRGDSDGFIAGDRNIKLIKEDMWMNNRKEAYRNCLERVAKGAPVSLPKDIVATTAGECEMLLKTMQRGGVRIDAIHDKGLISERSFRRFKTIPKWDTSYLDSAYTPYEIPDSRIDEIKDKISVIYLKPITIPSEEGANA